MATHLRSADALVQQPAASSWNQPCSEDHLAKIAKSISDWRAVSPFLGLTGAEEIEILESTHSVPARKMAMLRKWKEKRGAKATYKRLCRVFEDCERADLVDKVKQLLAESNSSSDDEPERPQEDHITVPNSLVEELASLRLGYATFLQEYKGALENSPKAQEVLKKTLPGLLRGLSSDRTFQSYFDALVDEEVSLFNVTYLEQFCDKFPEDICANTKQLVVNYKEQYQHFMGGSTLSQFKKLFPVSAVSSKLSTGKISITLKLENYWGDNTLSDLKKLVGLFGSHLHLEKIGVGSVIVNLLCSTSDAKELKGAIVQATDVFQKMGVLQVFIGEELVLEFHHQGATVVGSIANHSLTVYVDKLKRVYQTTPPIWLSLPNCKHIKLAMTNEKGTRHIQEPDDLIEHRVKGEVESLMASKVLVDMDSIFDEGTFENVHLPLVILVEGAFGSGKSTLAYHYCQKWAEGNLGMFELVALVYLRHPAVHSAGKGLTLHQLLLLASDGEEGIDSIARHVAHLVKDGLKSLLILDGWGEAPAFLRVPPDLRHPLDNSFLGNLLRSVSSNTTILITSRPDSSVDLHRRPNVKRLEILGFTKESIHDYFHEALSTQLPFTMLEDECRKLKDHLANYPAIESSCYIPLNAAILTILYLQHNCTLPTTHFEMFYELLLLCITSEVNTRQPEHTLGTISSLDALPRDLKKQLEHISILAYEGVMKNKIVFTQDELPSILPSELGSVITSFLPIKRSLKTIFLPGKGSKITSILSYILSAITPTPAQQDLPAMGVLQRVQWAGTSSKTISYNFVHPSIQEMLAAYRISQMGYSQQVRVFQTLLSKPRFTAVLKFYAGFTKLTNRGVRNIITGSDFTNDESSKFSLLNYVRCFFEAQIRDQLLYTKIISRLNGEMSLNGVTLSPLDCLSVGYFLSLVLLNNIELSVNLSNCSIDDNSIGLMMREFSKHAEACPAGAVLKLNISRNKIGDNGLAHIATALQTNTTTRTLNMENCSISFVGAESLARALAVNKSLQDLNISSNDIGDIGIACIATALQTNNTLKTCIIGGKTTTDEGALSLAAALTANSSMEYLKLYWSSTHPDSTLKKIGEYLRTSMLNRLELVMNMPRSGGAPLAEERAKEWLQCVEMGGKELILSLEDSRNLRDLHFLLDSQTAKLRNQCEMIFKQSIEALRATATAVNTARMQKGLPYVDIRLYIYSY